MLEIKTMNICKFCKEKEANKKNTHYLTDSIIRKCLNYDGSNKREAGHHFSFNEETPFIEYNFQRATPIEEIIAKLGRDPNEVELENARKNSFSVDNVFCSECEDKFTKIESDFVRIVLPKFRDENIVNTKELILEDESILCKKFFILQIYRSSICDEDISLNQDIEEKMRMYLFGEIDDINIPISVTYLQIIGDDICNTENYVGVITGSNPYVIFMCNFIIQCYDDENSIDFYDCFGINSETDYKKYINTNISSFIFRVCNNDERKEVLLNINTYKAGILKEKYRKIFTNIYVCLFRRLPTKDENEAFERELNIYLSSKEEVNKFSEERFSKFMNNYFERYIN